MKILHVKSIKSIYFLLCTPYIIDINKKLSLARLLWIYFASMCHKNDKKYENYSSDHLKSHHFLCTRDKK